MRRVSLFLCVLLTILVTPVFAQDSAIPWPTAGWQTSSPEAQGMDSVQLAAAVQQAVDTRLNIHSMLVIRNGYLVLEAYKFPYTADLLHQINSATKSFTSALVGIALEQGYIEGIDQPMLDYFPDRTIANLDAAKQSITIENLLTMSSGLDWSTAPFEVPTWSELQAGDDWIQFVLDRPMRDKPGELFVYNSGGSNLLAAIVEQATGKSLLDFAEPNLFEPLGIHDVNWQIDPQGHYVGGRGIWLTPRDMAKFGYLFLNNGQWDGQQIIPADWVAASSQKHINARNLADGYGYQWWVNIHGYYEALGAGGQEIVVIPQENMVVVFTSDLTNENVFIPDTLMQDMILPAVKSDEALPENPDGQAALAAAIDGMEQSPKSSDVPPLPDTATRISGKIYTLEANDWDWKSVTLTFDENSDTATFQLNDFPVLTLGLDDVFRVNPQAPTEVVFAKGEWATEKRFVLKYEYAGSIGQFQLTLTFEDNGVKMLSRDTFSGSIFSFTGAAS